MRQPKPEDREVLTCEMCNGAGRIAYGPWGVRPPKKECPECNGNGWVEDGGN